MTGRARGRRAPRAPRSDHGQAAVELALVLPVLILFLIAVVQTALVARDQVLVQDAARAAVREASVGGSDSRVRDAARRALGDVTVDVRRTGGAGGSVTVVAHYLDHTNLPLVGPLYPDVELRAQATMRAER